MRFLLALFLLLLPGVGLAAPLSFTIGTSEPVVVDTSGGTPLIWLDFGGGEARAATYRAGSGTAALEFAYDIAAGDFAPSGIVAAGQIELAGGAIRDLAGNPLTLNFTPPDLSGVRVRTYRPVWTTDPITAANASAAAFEITKAPLDATFAWEITSDGGGSASGSGTISAAPHPVTGLDLSALGDGTLTLSLTLTTAAGTSAPRTVTVAKSTPWIPADLGPALALWFDADDPATLTLDGASVSQWRDKSGNGRHLSQGSAARRPTLTPGVLNGKPAILLDGVNDFLSASGVGAAGVANVSFLIVMRYITASEADIVIGIGTNPATSRTTRDLFRAPGSSLQSFGTYANDAFGNIATDVGGAHHIFEAVQDGRNVRFWRTGEPGSPQPIAMPSDPLPIGVDAITIGGSISPSDGSGPVQPTHATFAEVVVSYSAISDTDRQRLEGYLAHKWGLAGSLPAGHPWKAAAP
jgi:hypothetical protein